MKILRFIKNNSIFLVTLFLLAFIPLYPKIPLLGINHVWVYIRAEDFVIAFATLVWFIEVLRRRATFKSPLTIPILIFWGVGFVSTGYAIIFLFPHMSNVFPLIAFLFYLRQIEYMILFIIAYSAVVSLSKKHAETQENIQLTLSKTIRWILLALCIGYIGYFFFDTYTAAHTAAAEPAFLTTKFFFFALAGVLGSLLLFKKKLHIIISVLVFTVISVVLYGLSQRYLQFPAFLTGNEEFAKGIPLKISALGRIPATFAGHYDLAAYLVMLIPIFGSMIFGIKKWSFKILLFVTAFGGLVLLLMTASRTSFAVYLVAVSFMLFLQKKKWFIIPVIIASILLLRGFTTISDRFTSTFSQVDVVVDARTGKAIGIAQGSGNNIVIQDVQSTGENLPQGSSYINLPSQQIQETTNKIVKKSITPGTNNVQVTSVAGDFAIKKVIAYDVSFTTRFQGEWPRAWAAFQQNYLLGSGYSSISLATDGNYLRILGETGALGFISFFAIFLVYGIYVYRVLPEIDSPIAKSFVIGVTAGILGLFLNAVLIDVFEASKDAYTLWTLMGISVGVLHLYQKKKVHFLDDVKAVLTSPIAIGGYLLVITFSVYSIILGNYFVGDDFTWLRWIADCKKVMVSGTLQCQSTVERLKDFFLNSQGFFYRPGAKIYFFIVYTLFWLSNPAYHVASIFFHFVAAVCVFILLSKIFKSKLFGFVGGLFFAVLSGNYEAVFWIASTGHLIAGASILLALVFHTYYREKKNIIFFILAFLCIFAAPFFIENGIVGPFILVAYDLILLNEKRKFGEYIPLILYFIPLPIYWYLRTIAHSLWFGGDYSYRLSALPFNVFGNAIGYFALAVIGVGFLPYYDALGNYGKNNVTIIAGIVLVVLAIILGAAYSLRHKISSRDARIVIFSIVFFFLALAPFLGLGNMTPRYLYLASVGVVTLFVFIFEKLYRLFEKRNMYAAYTFFGVVVALFCWFHINQLNIINVDWKRASAITNNLQLSFNSLYSNGNIGFENPVFYFVNTPIKTGTAWVFPVGLQDAMWFTFQNTNLTVHQVPSLDQALKDADASSSARVFEFQKNGSIEEVEHQVIMVSPTPMPRQ